MRFLPSKRSKINPFLVMEVLKYANELERNGQDLAHMEIGQPASAAPKSARDAVIKALNQPLGYSDALGVYALREEITKDYRRKYDVNITPERVILTTGSSTGFLLSFLALLDVGGRLGIARPGYPSYRNIAYALGVVPVEIATVIENNFQPTMDDISKEEIDAVLIASPANPTGSMLKADDLNALIQKAENESIPFISDEIYHGLSYGQKAHSALQYSQNVFVINSFSKYFAMTGWRLGWMIVPEDWVAIFEPLCQNLFICPPHISQIAALGALKDQQESEALVTLYSENRELLIAGMKSLRWTNFAEPNGAFYLYVDISHLKIPSDDLVKQWLNEGVAATSGLDFDRVNGHNYVRFSYAGSKEDIHKTIARLSLWQARITK